MDEVRKDNLACGAVLATMLATIACGAFVVEYAPDAPTHVAHDSPETDNE